MELLMGIFLMILIGWIGIKSLKVVFWIVGVILIANFLSVAFGLIATIVIVAILLLSHKPITDGFLIFICLAFFVGLVL